MSTAPTLPTIDPSTPVGLVRELARDTDLAAPLFSDAVIVRFLSLVGGVELLAAALALETTAADEALVQKRITLLDLSTDGPATAAALRATAAEYRATAAAAAASARRSGSATHRPSFFTTANGGRGG